MCYEMTPRYLCSDIFKIVLILKISLVQESGNECHCKTVEKLVILVMLDLLPTEQKVFYKCKAFTS